MKFLTDDPGRSRVGGLIDTACLPLTLERSVKLPARTQNALVTGAVFSRRVTDRYHTFFTAPALLHLELTSRELPYVYQTS